MMPDDDELNGVEQREIVEAQIAVLRVNLPKKKAFEINSDT